MALRSTSAKHKTYDLTMLVDDNTLSRSPTASNLETARASRVNADAGVAAAQRQLDATLAALETAQAQVIEAQAIHKKDTDDAERYRQLPVKDQIAEQTYDQTVQAVAADKATVDARMASVNQARQNVAAAQASVQEAQTRIPQADASIESAMTRPQQVAQSQGRARSAEAKVKQQQAILDQAKLNLTVFLRDRLSELPLDSSLRPSFAMACITK